MMRCAHLITDLEVGGAETMLSALVRRMDPQRVTSSVISLSDAGALGSQLRDAGIEVVALDVKRQGTVRAFLQLTAWLKRFRPDVLQTWLYHSDCFGLLAGRAAGVRRIFWNVRRTAPQPADPSWVRPMVRLNAVLSRFVDRIVVNSEAGRRAHIQLGYPERKMTVVPNGIDTERFHPDPAERLRQRESRGIPPDAFVIGMAARWQPIKGYPTLLEAAGRFVRQFPDTQLVLAGKGITTENDALMAGLRNAGLENRALLLGLVQDLACFYSLCDVYTSASYGEGFSNVVAEAMASGLPCVVTDVGDSALMIGASGERVEPQQPDQLLEAWRSLRGLTSSQRASLGQAARERIVQHYSLNRIARQMEALYEQTV